MTKNISKEENFLLQCIFYKDKIKSNVFNDLNYDLLVKICSEHLMLPTLYYHLKKRKILSKIPAELKNYLKNIYALNRERNETLLKEVVFLCKKLEENNIDYCLTKGLAMLVSGLYNDIGVRMIGDVDILVLENEKSEIVRILNNNNYFNSHDYIKWNANVLPSFSNKDKILSIDLHFNLLSKKFQYLIDNRKVLKDKIRFRNLNTIDFEQNLLHSIYNYQIDDYGFIRMSYSYRKIYDIYLLKEKIKIVNLKENKYTNSFFMISNYLKVTNHKIDIKIRDKIYLFFFLATNKYKLIRIINNLIYLFTKLFRDADKKIIEFIFNQKYRNKFYNYLKL